MPEINVPGPRFPSRRSNDYLSKEIKKAAQEKAKAVVEQLRSMWLKEVAKKVEDGIEETLTYCVFPCER